MPMALFRRIRSTLTRGDAVAVGALAALALLFWLPHGAAGRAPFHDVLLRLFFPDAAYVRRAAAEGFVPFWNPYVYSGVPFFANFRSALLYPFTYLHLALSFPTAVIVNLAIHAFLAGVFTYALARDIGMRERGAFLAAIVFAFNGFLISHFPFTSHVQSYVWLPLLFLLLRRAIRGSWLGVGGAAAALALQIIGGRPEFVLYSAVAVAIEIIYPGVFAGSDAPRRGRVAWLAVAVGALALAWTAVQWQPAWAFLRQTPDAARSFEWITLNNVRPLELARMLAEPLWSRHFRPSLGDWHLSSIYLGLPVLALAAVGAWPGLDEHRRSRRSLVAVAMVGLLPLVHLPAQTLYLACFGFALLAGIGLDRLRLRPITAGLLIVTCAADLWMFSTRVVETTDSALYRQVPPTAETLVNRASVDRMFVSPVTRTQILQGKPSDTVAPGTLFRDALLPNLPMADGLFDAGGQGARPWYYNVVLKEISESADSPWMNALGVRYVLSQSDRYSTRWTLLGSGAVNVFENKNALPRVYAVTGVRIGNDELSIARSRQNGFDFSLGVLLTEDAVMPAVASDGAEAWIQDVSYRPGRVTVRAKARGDVWLVFAETYDAGWRALVNGDEKPVLRANVAQMAIQLPPGLNEIVFAYRPAHFGFLLAVSVGSFLLFWTACFVRLRPTLSGG